MSTSITFVAWSGPVLVTDNVYTIVSPSAGSELLTVFTVTKSTDVTRIVSSLSSTVILLSNWSWLFIIVFVRLCPAVPPSTRTFKERVSVVPTGKELMVQLGLEYAPFVVKLDK